MDFLIKCDVFENSPKNKKKNIKKKKNQVKKIR